MKTITKLWILIAVLAVLTPIGLILPGYFKAGAAWGEWGIDEIQKFIGYIPKGLERLSSLWSAPMPDYSLKGWEAASLARLSVSYIMSAVLGLFVIIGLVYIIGKFLGKKE